MTIQTISRHASACCLALAALAACAAPITVGADHDARADWSRWHTWAEASPGQPAADSVIDRRIRDSIAKVLTERGFARAPADSADFLVSHHTQVRREKELFETMNDPYSGAGFARSGGSMYSGTSQVIEYDVGTLVIDLIDRKGGFVAWTGHAESTVDASAAPADRDRRIEEGVRKTLAQFPPASR